jgi:hypothetical protein
VNASITDSARVGTGAAVARTAAAKRSSCSRYGSATGIR